MNTGLGSVVPLFKKGIKMGNSESDIARKKHREQTEAVKKEYMANLKKDTFLVVEEFTNLPKHVPRLLDLDKSSLLIRRAKELALTASFSTEADTVSSLQIQGIDPLASPQLSKVSSDQGESDDDKKDSLTN